LAKQQRVDVCTEHQLACDDETLCKVITGDLAPGDFLPISKNDTEAEMTPV
jgi:hypothetical protein